VLHQKYVVEGATTAQIANELLCSKSAIRAALLRANIPLQGKGRGSRTGQVALGIKVTRGRLVQCGAEEKVIQTIADLRRDGLSFDKIAAVLTRVGVPTKTRRRKWNGGCVRAIYLRHSQGV